MNRMQNFAMAALLLLATTSAIAADGPADYPNRPTRLLVPFTAGGSADMYSRAIAQRLGDSLKQAVVVENRPGANGVIGTKAAAVAAPDGYTLMMGNVATIAVNPFLYRNLPYDANAAFVPITQVATAPFVMVVSTNSPVRTVADFVALAKSRPNTLNYASTGNGSPAHLAGELLQGQSGIKLQHVPYSNMGSIMTDLFTDRVQMSFIGIAVAKAQIAAGKLRPLATTGPTRSPAMPDVPTVAEAGIAGFDVSGWYGVFAPKGTPDAIVKRLSNELVKITRLPEVKASFSEDGAEVVGDTPQEFTKHIDSERKKWSQVVKAAGIQLD